MRRIFLCFLCIFLLTTAVSAANSVTTMQSNAVLDADGTCEITLVLQLSLDHVEEKLRFPLPQEARDISLNGSSAKTMRDSSLRWVDLSGAVYGPGSHSLTLHYSLPDLITAEESGLVLNLPLLSGFAYPIEGMDFSITLPGETTEIPTFSSLYHPSMDTQLAYTIDGPVISGYFLEGLKDHETLTMKLPVSGDLFPQPIVKQWSLSDDDVARYALTILAAVYWLIFLRCKFPRGLRRVQAPGGITAGELGCCLIGQGVDFSMMVLSWAQMGYLSIQLDRHGKVLLHKRMDMGNERSDFEVRAFKTLFGSRKTVNGSGDHYTRLGRKAARTIPGAWQYFKKRTGNPLIFRCLAAGIGVFAGISLASAFASDTAWRVIFSLLLVPSGAVLCWLIQSGARELQLRHKYDLLLALGCSLVWMLLGALAGESNVTMYVIVSQIIAGLASAHGGRRTEAGLQARNEILGLRRYLKTISPTELDRILQNNPDYYFTMAPYAMALGVDNAFARHFGEAKLSPCPYLLVDGNPSWTARQWNARLRQMLRTLDERQYKMALQSILGK